MQRSSTKLAQEACIGTTAGTALLFDIDGTLADTDALRLDAFNRIFAPHGHRFDHARFARDLQGFSMASIRECFLGAETADRQLKRATILAVGSCA